jgi:fibronectin-binding autotransporter adhesin
MTKYIKSTWNWSPPAAVLGGVILMLWLATVIWAQSSMSGTGGGGGTGVFGTSAVQGPTFNIAVPTTLCAGCNAVADWKLVTDGICTNGSASISSASFGFTTAASVGKHVLFYSPGSSTANGDATIFSVQSGTTATVNASYTSGCTGIAENMAVFTDNGPALNAAENACVTAGRGVVYVPAGIYGSVSRFWFNNTGSVTCTYVGAGTVYSGPSAAITNAPTVIKISPWTPFSALQLMSFGNTNMKDIVFDAMTAPWPNVASNVVAVWNGNTEVDHVAFSGFSFTNNTNAVCDINSDSWHGLDLACGANAFPGPGGIGLIVHSLSATCINCRITGSPAVAGTDVGNSQFIGGAYQAAGGAKVFDFNGSSGGGKNNLISGAYIGCFATVVANSCIDFASNLTADLRDITIDNQGVNSTFIVRVANSMTVPFPTISGLRLRGAGTTPTITLNTSGAFKDGCGNDPGVTVTGGTVFGSCSITGTTQTSGNWSVPAGSGAGQWGTSPSVACPGTAEVAAGTSSWQACTITVGSGTVGANPIVTITFPTPFLAAPSCQAQMTGGTAAFALFANSGNPTTTTAAFLYGGTPGASTTIGLQVRCGNG